jgi:cystathionine beta-lyase
MVNSVKTFLKQVGKDYQNQSVNPPVVRASTIIFKTLQDIKKTQSNYKKNPLSKNFDYGRKGTSTTFALQELSLLSHKIFNRRLFKKIQY